MNNSMLIGIIAGAGIAAAGGVAGFSLLNSTSDSSAVENEVAAAEEQAPDMNPQGDVQIAEAAGAAENSVAEECWDEEVTVQADPRDDHAIAGTAAGALIGGAIADRLGVGL